MPAKSIYPVDKGHSSVSGIVMMALDANGDPQPISPSNPLPGTSSGGGGGSVTGTVGIDQTTPGTTNGVVVNSSVLPTGAATQATLSALLTSDTAISTATGAIADAKATDSTSSWSVIALLKGAYAQLTALIALFPSTLGTKTAALSFPVTLAPDGTLGLATGTTADSLATDSTSSWSIIALLKGILAKLIAPASVGHSATVTITRPATTPTYAINAIIGDVGGSGILTFANMARAAGDILITSIELEVDLAAIPTGMTGFMLRLYNVSPTAIADTNSWDIVTGDHGKYLGRIQLATPIDEGSTLFIDNDNINKQVTLTGTSLFVEVQTLGTWTAAASTVFKLTIHATEV